MTATVNRFTHATVGPVGSDAITVMLTATVIVVLSLLLVEKEMVRTFGRTWGRRSQQGLNVAVGPLWIAFATIVVVRLAVTIFHRHWS